MATDDQSAEVEQTAEQPADKPAKKAKKDKKDKKEKGSRAFFLWGGLGVLVLVLGVVMSVYYIQRAQLSSDNRLRIIQDFVGRFSGKIEQTISGGAGIGRSLRRMAGFEEDPFERPSRSGTYTYDVEDGDNLWRIANSGDLVETPWEWPTIFSQNRDKMDYALMSVESGGWKVLMEPGQRLTVTGGKTFNAPDDVPRKFAVQMLSLEQEKLDLAVKIVGALLKGGRFAYMYRMDVNDIDWYRIRVGFFEDRAAARSAGESIRIQFRKRKWFRGQKPWVLRPLMEEIRGERLEYGAQNVNPFVIELPPRASHGEAISDLRKIAELKDFVYVTQDRDPVSENFRYRARVGFYATEMQAKRVIDGQEGDSALWASARIVHVTNFEEVIPGQNLQLYKPAEEEN